MVEFKYKVISISDKLNDEDDEEVLNKYGKDGWELVSIFIHPATYHTFYFKKKIVPSVGIY